MHSFLLNDDLILIFQHGYLLILPFDRVFFFLFIKSNTFCRRKVN